MGKRFLYFGYQYKDFLLYMAWMLNDLGYLVLLNDSSKDQGLMMLIEGFSAPMAEQKIITYRGVDIFVQGACSDKAEVKGEPVISGKVTEGRTEGYHYVFDYINELTEASAGGRDCGSYDGIIVNMDFSRTAIRRWTEWASYSGVVRESLGESEKRPAGEIAPDSMEHFFKGDILLVLRDETASVPDNRFFKESMVEIFQKNCRLFRIPFDFYDKDYQYRLEYGEDKRLKRLSEDYGEVLRQIVLRLSDSKPAEVKRAWKHLKEGRLIDNRLLE